MKYQLNETELIQVNSYGEKERLNFFLSRTIESEEVWGLSNQSGWIMKEEKDKTILPVWPYDILALNCAADVNQDYSPGAVSLEHFVYNLLPVMVRQEIKVEIFPTATQAGHLLNAKELASLFEGLLESGEYYMEG